MTPDTKLALKLSRLTSTSPARDRQVAIRHRGHLQLGCELPSLTGVRRRVLIVTGDAAAPRAVVVRTTGRRIIPTGRASGASEGHVDGALFHLDEMRGKLAAQRPRSIALRKVRHPRAPKVELDLSGSDLATRLHEWARLNAELAQRDVAAGEAWLAERRARRLNPTLEAPPGPADAKPASRTRKQSTAPSVAKPKRPGAVARPTARARTPKPPGAGSELN